MNDKNKSSTDSQRMNEQLSAYLDGELSEAEKHKLEEQIHNDSAIKHRFESLQKNWLLLDQLSAKKANPDFAASTVEMVAIRSSEIPEVDCNKSSWEACPRWLLISGAAVIAVAIGYFTTIALIDDRNGALLEHLVLLENLPEYQLVDDVTFVEQIGKIEYFSSRAEVAPYPGLVQDSVESDVQKRFRLNAMPYAKKRLLLDNYNTFQQISGEEQIRLIDLHQDLLAANDADTLSKLLVTYAHWYQQLDSSNQVELSLRANKDKILLIHELVKEDSPLPPRHSGQPLFYSNKDRVILMQWLEGVAIRNEEKILKRVNNYQRDQILRLSPQEKNRRLVFLLIKNIKRDKMSLSKPGERKEYTSMVALLSSSLQQRLAKQDSFDARLRLIIDILRVDSRGPRFRTTPAK
ncbi:MAG: hypothetical protein P8K78_02470 [Pirellulales bacterium]|nr:hypothetical protein [Pirellulales bacterium]